MIRRYRGLAILTAILAVAVAILAVPEIRLGAFGGSVSRGNENSFLGLTLGLDLQGGTHLVYRVVPEDGGLPTADDVAAVRTILESRVNAFGVSEATVQELGQPPDRVLIQIPGRSGASLNINFRPSQFFGRLVSGDALEEFFRNELGRPDADVTESTDDFSLTVRLDSIRPAEIDAVGNVVTPGEADLWRPLIEAEFPAILIIVFTPQAVDDASGSEGGDGTEATPTPGAGATATPEPQATPTPDPQATPTPTPEPVTVVPSLEEVQQAVASAGFPDAVVEELAEGQYSVELVGLQTGKIGPDGERLPDDLDVIREEIRKVGTIAFWDPQGDIIGWTVGGGVEEAKALIGSTALLEFRERKCGPATAPAGVEVWPPEGLTLAEWEFARCQDPRFYDEQATGIDPDDLVDAFAGTQPGVARPVVNIVFNDAGADAFFDVTDRIARNGDLLAIYLDNKELVAPGASQGIAGGRAFIQGPDFTAERARTIAIQLRAGALPATLELIQERNVDATLGDESLRQSLVAGAVGLALLLAFMVIYYKVPGLLAAVMLVAYTIVLIAIFKLIPVTMTLSGAAALILSLGFAIDANILIAERIKEELRTGRTILPAINAGFDRAWPSIRDGNVSTLITAAVLFWFGDRFSTSIMQGFALTLGIGVLLSMFTAFFASRILLRLVARTKLGERTNLFVPVTDTGASLDGEA
ncbi:MAG: protein translocase subunit SecD [Chloroflexi bacterium]|nr:protein translocase subunit SecD [Chloroflexota bacterium]